MAYVQTIICMIACMLYIQARMTEEGPFPRMFAADIATSMTPSSIVCEQGTGSNEGTVHTPRKQD